MIGAADGGGEHGAGRDVDRAASALADVGAQRGGSCGVERYGGNEGPRAGSGELGRELPALFGQRLRRRGGGRRRRCTGRLGVGRALAKQVQDAAFPGDRRRDHADIMAAQVRPQDVEVLGHAHGVGHVDDQRLGRQRPGLLIERRAEAERVERDRGVLVRAERQAVQHAGRGDTPGSEAHGREVQVVGERPDLAGIGHDLAIGGVAGAGEADWVLPKQPGGEQDADILWPVCAGTDDGNDRGCGRGFPTRLQRHVPLAEALRGRRLDGWAVRRGGRGCDGVHGLVP